MIIQSKLQRGQQQRWPLLNENASRRSAQVETRARTTGRKVFGLSIAACLLTTLLVGSVHAQDSKTSKKAVAPNDDLGEIIQDTPPKPGQDDQFKLPDGVKLPFTAAQN